MANNVTTISLDPSLSQTIGRLASERDLTKVALLRRLVRAYEKNPTLVDSLASKES